MRSESSPAATQARVRPALPPTQAAIEHLRRGPCETKALAAALGVPGGKVGGLLKYALLKGKVQRKVIKEPQSVRTSVWSLPGMRSGVKPKGAA